MSIKKVTSKGGGKSVMVSSEPGIIYPMTPDSNTTKNLKGIIMKLLLRNTQRQVTGKSWDEKDLNEAVDAISLLLQEAEDRGYKKAKARLRQSITRMSRFKDDHIELPIDWWDRKLADLDAELTDKESK